MNDKTASLQSEAVLGHIINSLGEPIEQETDAALSVFETGIKPVDLLTPIPRGGITALSGEFGSGRDVLLEEIIYNLAAHHNGYAVCLTMDELGYEENRLVLLVREGNLQDKAVIIFEPQTDDREVSLRMVRNGLDLASQFRAQGREVLLVIDRSVAQQANILAMSEVRDAIRTQGIVAMLLTDPDGLAQSGTSSAHYTLDGRINMSRELARQGLYPAVDRLTSHSRLLGSSALSAEHRQVVTGVRQAIRGLQEPQTSVLAPEEQRFVGRAQRIQKFLTQPFAVTEPFTGTPGEYVPLAQTLKGFQALLEGRYDDLPEQAFYFAGTIEQVVAKGRGVNQQL